MPVKTAAAYIRVSDARQDEYSPASQLRLVREYAAKNGYLIPEEYVYYDDGISGSTASRRTAFRDMIAAAKQKDPPFQAILVWKFSRFARNQEESIVYKNLLKKNGVAVISVSEPISDDPFGGLIERIIEWMDEYYLIRLGPEVRRGMAERASGGLPVVPPPFGYLHDKATGQWFPDPDRAPVVREIFRRFVSGEGMQAIARSLNARGVRSKRGNPIDHRGVEYILKNPAYIGKLRFNPSGKKAAIRDFDYDADGAILVDGPHEPLIDVSLFDAAQQRFKEIRALYGKYQRPEQKQEYMLKGLVRCSACGATLTLVCAKSAPSLQCHRYSKGQCETSHFVRIPAAEAAVIDGLRKVAAGLPVHIDPPPSGSADAEPAVKAVADLEAQKAAALRRLDRLTDGYLNGAFTLDSFKQLKAALESDLADRKAAALAAAAADADAPQLLRRRVADVLAVVTDPASSETSKAVALRSVLSSVTFNRPLGTFDLHFHL